MAVQSNSMLKPPPTAGAQSKKEFRVENAYVYSLKSPLWWLYSHISRYWYLFITAFIGLGISYASYSYARILIADTAAYILNPTEESRLTWLAIGTLTVLVLDGLANLVSSISNETIAQRLERDARQELYISLLGKSQTFHDRQRVGDIMARATDDMRMMNGMMSPGVSFMFEMVLGFAIPMFFIATVKVELLAIPFVFLVSYIIVVRRYVRRLSPVIGKQREAFGKMNAGLEESISGIEVVKASSQEMFEKRKFRRNAREFRDYFVQQGQIEAFYLPLLLYGFMAGATFFHALMMYQAERASVPDIIAVMGLIGILRFPVFLSLFSFSLVQNGVRSAERVLRIIKTETELDENAAGHNQPIAGEIVFEDVTFSFGHKKVIENISFKINAGATVALVGQTGAGKTTLTQLINRTYDVDSGRILIDGIDVRQWSMDGLRSQISRIEQDVFLFSRTIRENIAFGAPDTPAEKIEEAARDAQAHEFIMSFKDGYDTVIGERGVTLSGGQRQRIALARAFLSNPRILVLDDSTSAVDSATEDQIQRAIRKAQEGRTVILITHRLSQIRWADLILVVDKGKLVASGTHEQLLRTSPEYRRIFARYDVALPPLEVPQAAPVLAGD